MITHHVTPPTLLDVAEEFALNSALDEIEVLLRVVKREDLSLVEAHAIIAVLRPVAARVAA